MAEVSKNIITQGASGMLGGLLVFRQVKGKTIMSIRPKQPETRSEKQQAHLDRFQMAVFYGKTVIADPNLKEEYSKGINDKKGSAYVVALADFMNAPDIYEVNLSLYKGAIGDTIKISVTDDFKVALVQVEITNADGTLVESGNAVQQPNGIEWLYTATAANQSIQGDRIIIKAYDKPGNVTTEERIA